jgi:hypothetical protein
MAEADLASGRLGSAGAGAAGRVLLVWPVFTHVLPEAFAAFLGAAIHAARHTPFRYDVMVCPRELLHAAMTRAAEALLAEPATRALIAFDDDCLPPQDAIPRLLAALARGRPIVAGVSFMRGYPFTTTVARLRPEGPVYEPTAAGWEARGFDWLDDLTAVPREPDGLVRADFCGFPVVAIRREVFERTPPPWFAHHDGTGAAMTHDVYFCQRARDAGFLTYVDPELECGHLIPSPVLTRASRDAARAWVQQHGER